VDRRNNWRNAIHRSQASRGEVEDRVKVVWTPEAEQDRADILDYIAADNPHAAVRMDELFSRG
jgi:hypothetical protein